MTALLLVLSALALILLYALATRVLNPRVDSLRESNPASLVGGIIQVEVRNGCGVAGLAAQTTRFLRRHGFDVVDVGDHTSFDAEYSMVIDRVGDLASAKKVAAVLGITEDRIHQEIRLDYYLDASIVIGRDYESLRPFRDP